MIRLPALTLWQPWATLVAGEMKPFEFRHWPAPERLIGGRIAIHAGARKVSKPELAELIVSCRMNRGWGTGLFVEPALELLERLHQHPTSVPLSTIVCTAVLGRPRRAAELFGGQPGGDSDRIDKQIWAWPLTEIRRLEPPTPYRGAQGFWTCELEEAALAA